MKTNNVFINPLTDFGFKRVFASEENKDILIAFLNDCIIPPVYSFNILDYNAPEFMGREECFWAVHLKDNQNRIFSKKIILFFMELTKFAAQFPDEKSPAYKWGYALKHMSGMSLKDMPEEAGEFRKLFEVCQMSRLTTMEKNDYEKSIFEYEDVQDALECMRRHSLKEGYEQGMQQGKEEALLQTARNLLDLGVSLVDVAKATGLSEKEILAHVGKC